MVKTKQMHTSFGEVREYAALVIAVIGATLALVAFWKKILAVVLSIFRAVIGWVTLPTKIMRDVAAIKMQTLPNGGKSLCDAIKRLEDGVGAIRNKQLENYQITSALASNDDVGIWQSDKEGNCTAINQNILRRVGFSESEALGKGWVNYIAPQDRERVYIEWFKACAQSRDFIMKYNFVDQSGNLIPISAHSYVIRDVDGEIVKYIGLVNFLKSTEKP